MLSSSSLRTLLFVVLLYLRWLVSLCYITIPIALYLLLLNVVNLFLSFVSCYSIFFLSVVVSSTIMSKNVYINNEMRRAFWFSMRSHCWKFYDSDKFLLPFSIENKKKTHTQNNKNSTTTKMKQVLYIFSYAEFPRGWIPWSKIWIPGKKFIIFPLNFTINKKEK